MTWTAKQTLFGIVFLAWAAVPWHARACSVLALDVTGLAFGVFSVATDAGRPAAGTIRLRCVKGGASAMPFTVDLVDGSGTDRSLRRSHGGVLQYRLFVDAAARRPWGDGRAGTEAIVGVFPPSPTGAEMVIPIYGTITAGQQPAVGRYSDTLVARLTYGGSRAGTKNGGPR